MNDNSFNEVSYEPEILEEPTEPTPVKHKKQKKNPDLMLRVLPILSALILLFTLIVTVTVLLVNMHETPDVPDQPTVLQPPENAVKIPEYRPRPSIAITSGAVASNAYLPAGIGEDIPKYFESPTDRVAKVNAKAAVLVELNGRSIVAGRESDKKLPIASMTKVMTLLVCLDYISEGSEDELYRVISLQYNEALLSGYNCAFIDKSSNKTQDVYVIDALYGLVLESGADCAYGLASHFAGSEAEFVKKMNAKAASLGMSSTTFTNCVGKDDGGKNLSTVRDVAAMFVYALDNPLGYEIISTSKWTCIGAYYYQTLSSLVHTTAPKNNRDYGSISIVGGKSGLEDMALNCLVTLGTTEDGARYVCVVAGTDNSYTDTAAIYRNLVE